MTRPEPVTADAPHRVARPMLTQTWSRLTFLHWPYDPAAVRRLLPPGVEPDLADGAAWVGLIPFAMSRVRILGTPALPYVSHFLETNVRTYTVAADGGRGVTFLSLDASRLAPVLAARVTLGLPYCWSRMGFTDHDGTLSYACRRRWPGAGARSVLRVRPGAPVAMEPIDEFHTARWRLHTRVAGRSVTAPVEHPRWQLRHAEVLALDDGLIAAAGLPAPDGPPRVRYAEPVEVRFGLPRAVRG